jgi:hypothetical protein
MDKKIRAERWRKSIKDGTDTENKFAELMKQRGVECVKTSSHVDMRKHIDFFIGENIGVDIKGRRHLETIWVELQNVRGNDGWLKGDAKYIVFDIIELKSFCFFEREKLLEYVINFTETTTNKKDYLKWYSRKAWGRDDKIMRLNYNHIKHLETKKINY